MIKSKKQKEYKPKPSRSGLMTCDRKHGWIVVDQNMERGTVLCPVCGSHPCEADVSGKEEQDAFLSRLSGQHDWGVCPCCGSRNEKPDLAYKKKCVKWLRRRGVLEKALQ